jgi:hypothetical protein
MLYHRLLEWHVEADQKRDWPFLPLSGDFRERPDYFLSYYAQPASSLSFRKTAITALFPIPERIRMLGDCFLASLIPLLAPIGAIPDALALYRIHGQNGYSIVQPQVPVEIAKNRLQMRTILMEAMKRWLASNGYSRTQIPVRVFLNHWHFALEAEAFVITPPGRLRFFRFMLFENYIYRSMQTWKFTAFRYATACSALVFGYKNSRRAEEWRSMAVIKMAKFVRRFFPRDGSRDLSEGSGR